MKTTIKRENNEILVISLKHVSRFTGNPNRPGGPKLWAVSHENDRKTRKRRVLGHNLKHVSSHAVLVNLPSNPKLWAIANQNGHTTRKRQVFGRNSQTCIRPYGHYKYP